jgi:hypothetical protein
MKEKSFIKLTPGVFVNIKPSLIFLEVLHLHPSRLLEVTGLLSYKEIEKTRACISKLLHSGELLPYSLILDKNEKVCCQGKNARVYFRSAFNGRERKKFYNISANRQREERGKRE